MNSAVKKIQNYGSKRIQRVQRMDRDGQTGRLPQLYIKYQPCSTGTLVQLFPLLERDSTLTTHNKLILYKLFIRSALTYAAPVWSYISPSTYRRLQVLQSKCLRVIGNYPRCTPIPHLHTTLNIPPIRDFIYHLTDKFFSICPTHPNPLIRSIGNYTLADLQHQYKKYIHKRPKHILL